MQSNSQTRQCIIFLKCIVLVSRTCSIFFNEESSFAAIPCCCSTTSSRRSKWNYTPTSASNAEIKPSWNLQPVSNPSGDVFEGKGTVPKEGILMIFEGLASRIRLVVVVVSIFNFAYLALLNQIGFYGHRDLVFGFLRFCSF